MHRDATVPLLDGIQSVLNPKGPNAAVIAEIAWVLFIGGGLIFLAVMALAAWAAFARRRSGLGHRAAIVGGGIVFPAVVLFALLVYTLLAAARLTAPRDAELSLVVTAKQWWWEVHYLAPDGTVDFVTANEIRLPVGREVAITLLSQDVLHSFWVPALAGKLDAIPGRRNVLRLKATATGIYRGQCAEYCGGPHAQMAFFVVGASAEDFEAWRRLQREPARTAPAGRVEKGEAVFLSYCAACHTVRGTPAGGTLGPDLTHVGSRLSLAAGILPNNRGTIAAWVAGSQHIKPENLMPSFSELTGEELTELAAYLESLQ